MHNRGPLSNLILKCLLFCLFLLSQAASYGQCPNSFKYILKGTDRDIAVDIIELPGGDKVIGGYTSSFGAGGNDIFLTRMKNDGTIVWNKTYGGIGSDYPRKIRLSDDGNILVVGFTQSYDNPSGSILGLVVDPNGSQLLSVQLGESSGNDLGLDMIHTPDNGYVITGTHYTPAAASDWIIVKLDAAGNILWNKKLDRNLNEDAFSVLTKQDTIVICGDSQDPPEYSGVIVKMSLATGTLYSTNAYAVDSRGFFSPKMFLQTNQYRIGMQIIDQSSYSNMQLGFVTMDTLLNLTAAFKTVASPSTTFPYSAFSITQDGGFLAAGSAYFSFDGILHKFDKNNNLQFTRHFSLADDSHMYSVIQGSDNSIWMVGATVDNHAFVIKLDQNGHFQSCPNDDVTATTQSVTFPPTPFSWTGESSYNLLPPAITPSVIPFTFTVDALCVSPACTQVQMTGKDTICSLTDSTDFTLITPGGCAGVIAWDIPSGIDFRMVNDSVARAVFIAGGSYKIVASKTIGCNILKDSIIVFIAPFDSLALGKDSVLCHSPSLLLDAGSGYKTYVWQDNGSQQTFTARSSGQYYVAATNYCHQTYNDTIKLLFRSPDSFGVAPTDTSYCIQGAFQLTSKGGDTYTWTPAAGLSDPAISNPVANPAASVLYNVRIMDTVCLRQTDLGVNITIVPPPVINIIKSNDLDCINGSAQLTATGGQNWQWSPTGTLSNPFINNPVASPTEPTMYYVHAVNSLGCPSDDSVFVDFSKTGDPAIYFPTAFSPNGDGHNDVFRIDTKSSLKVHEFSVYNRWGERVFTTINQHQGWDGYFNGHAQPAGIYVFFLKAFSPCAGEIFKKGTLMLIR